MMVRTIGSARRGPVTVRASAKVNLELRVGPAREDGYHDVATVYLAVSLYDDVTVRPAPAWSLTVAGRHAENVPLDETNLAWRGAQAVADRVGISEPVAIHIDKDIPVAGGMAGGSADAAAAVLAANHLWEAGLDRAEMAAICAELGSDVPFALSGGVAVGTGRGEQLAPVLCRGTFHFVFVLSADGLSTPTVYAEFDRRSARRRHTPRTPEPSADLLAALGSGDAYALAGTLRNDLEPAALELMPSLGQIIEAGVDFGALAGIVSGSGPTVAFLCADHEAALHLAVALTASGTARNVRYASGPVHGATVTSAPGRR